ncbi:RTA1-like protein [Panus rudis PR-1116 ss-1]|nr:RTA1-like protein [Panus rudis PR-1116 ss-1]
MSIESDSPYHYVPTEWICAMFVSLFGLSGLIHLVQALYYRTWWLIPTACVAAIAEVIGWSARLWSSKNPLLLDPFLMQISTTIIAPTPLIAANFIILGRLINGLGSCYSRLSSKWYLIIFTSCDLVALAVQAVGGAQASIAVNDGNDPNEGGHVMLGGIIFQLVAIVMYMLLATEFILRFIHDRPLRYSPQNNIGISHGWSAIGWRLQFAVASLAFSGICLLIRSIYRTIELVDGWDGPIISTQVYFNVLDGAMIVLAIFTLNIFHPGIVLHGLNVTQQDKDIELRMHSHPGRLGNNGSGDTLV